MSVSTLFKMGALALVLSAVAAHAPGVMAASVYKCVVNGSVSYQGDPCPSGQARQQPSAAQLNAERRKRQAQAAASAAAAPANQPPGAVPRPARSAVAPSPERPAQTPQADLYSCDGRTHCSQMRSCAEAQFFLAHCPGVKMDGDRNGLPCERQWCRPSTRGR